MRAGHCLGIVLAMSLAGCASTHGPLATVSAPITGSVTIGPASRELVPVVKTVTIACEPPPQFLSPHAPLPLIAAERLSQKQMIDRWLEDMAAYADLRADHVNLAEWVKTHCQS